jgi:hypothetical protein
MEFRLPVRVREMPVTPWGYAKSSCCGRRNRLRSSVVVPNQLSDALATDVSRVAQTHVFQHNEMK